MLAASVMTRPSVVAAAESPLVVSFPPMHSESPVAKSHPGSLRTNPLPAVRPKPLPGRPAANRQTSYCHWQL